MAFHVVYKYLQTDYFELLLYSAEYNHHFIIIVDYASKAATQYRVTHPRTPQKVKTLKSLTYNENIKEKQHTSNI